MLLKKIFFDKLDFTSLKGVFFKIQQGNLINKLLLMSTVSIAQTPQYELSINRIKNRAYLRIIGFWRNTEQVPEYLNEWKKAVAGLRPGFTLLTDAREMKIHPSAVRELHGQAQALILSKGVKKVAELQADKVAELQLDGVSKETKMPKRNFNERQEAEKWLDEWE